MLRGIDVSHWKSDLNLGAIHYDFVIAKATGGNGYVDPNCDKFVQKAISMGKKWGVFHYAGDGFGSNSPQVEADYFINNCLGYIGKGILVLDWERGGNPNVDNVAWAKAWLDRVYARTKVRPLIYMSLSLLRALDWSPVIRGNYGLWVAAWPQGNNVIANYGMNPDSDPNPTWDGKVNDVLWQFTSTGRLDGYAGNLDCDFFFGTTAAWDAYAKGDIASPAPPTTTTTTKKPTPPPPQPDPTTTTTTTVKPPEPEPEPTTTTTEKPEPEPSPPPDDGNETTTTTTKAPSPGEPVQGSGLWVAIVTAIAAFVVAVFNRLRGEQ